jgi:endonuclease III
VSNILRGQSSPEIDIGDVDVYTSNLYELNIKAQDAVREFALHDIDDREGLEKKRITMHNSFTELYDVISTFIEQIMVQDFDIAYIRNRIGQAEGEAKQQMEDALKELVSRAQSNQANVWMSRVLAWLHQAAAASGPFTEEENEENQQQASSHLAAVYTMLEKPFTAIPSKSEGTQKLRRVALGRMAYNLLKGVRDKEDTELMEIQGKNKIAEAEFYDEFLNELIGQESTFRQAFNPFDELLWRDILSSFIFEHATDLYNEAIPFFKKSGSSKKQTISMIKSWKQNTAGLSEVYLAMTYNDIADAQMRAGNLEDASKLYRIASDAFGRAEKCFREVISLQPNAEQSKNDKEQKKAQSNFCKAEASVQELSEMIRMNNRKEANEVLKEIFKALKKAEKLAKTRELTGAIQEDLKTFSFVEDLLKKKDADMSGILNQIEFAKDLRKTGLMQNVNKALDEASQHLAEDPAESLEAIREALNSLGILLSLEAMDEDVGTLRNKTLALLNNVKYVIQFQVSSQLEQGVNFIMSRILENLHAAEAASYYKVIGEMDKASELTDMGRLALATAYASEAQVFARQSEQWAFRAQIERTNSIRKLEDELSEFDDDDSVSNVVGTHDNCISKIKQSIASFSAAASELDVVKDENIREKNNVETQVKQLQGVVMKLLGDLSRMEGAKRDFMAEYMYRTGKKTKAQRLYSEANDQLRKAVGNYTVAAQVFQQLGDAQSAQSIDAKRQTADLLARGVWDNRQRLERDQEPTYKGDAELMALYQGSAGQ